ncbi:sulfatase [Sediminitomix flava]|uniref:Arylsulfatase A-like enzyme n=1 Tax=Sediminitomix flava TaxID=379075 RepID=A0A315Z4G4_SEDFL|nr:sulfatase [Sediminitomix flava]PWJ37979.1 arylsulfatase A-like enzyme [Sediminitomix flava]
MKNRLTSKLPIFLSVGILICFSAWKSINTNDASLIERPNFIFIAVDDLNSYNSVLGDIPSNFLQKVYPDAESRKEVLERLTPNMDKLASQAITFTRAYSPSPLCGPSRTATLTGVPTHVSGYYEHDRHFRAYKSLTKVKTLPQYLREQGYFTTGIGKVFHKGRAYLDRGYFSDWPDQLYSWSEWINTNVGTGRGSNSPLEEKEEISKYWKQGNKTKKDFRRFGTSNVPVEQTWDYLNAKHISDLILKGHSTRRDNSGELKKIVLPKDQPYFLACGLFAPHLPWVTPKEFADLFPQEEMELDEALIEDLQKDLDDLSKTGKRVTQNTAFKKLLQYGIELDGKGGDLNAWKAAFQAYLATIAYSDRNIGVLLDAINRNPSKENTIVVLWSDHGYHLGDKMRKGKTTLWEAANRCNLMILDPRAKSKSQYQETDALVSLQDIYPTICSLAGLEKPSHVAGNDLSSLLENPKKSWEYMVLNTYQEGNHALRSDQFRYIEFKNGDQELYDMKNDPFEIRNLVEEEGFKETVIEMKEALSKRLKFYNQKKSEKTLTN